MSEARRKVGQERVGEPIVNAIEAVLHVALQEPGVPLEPLRDYMQSYLSTGYVSVIDAGTGESLEALERIEPEAVQRTALLLVQDFLAWYGRAAREPSSEVDARASRIVTGAAARLDISAPTVPVPIDHRTEAWAADVVRALGLSSEVAMLLAVGHLTEINDHCAAASASAKQDASWSWKDESPALVRQAMADFALVTVLALQATPRDSEVWMRRRTREISSLIERYFGDRSGEAEILRLANQARERLSSERSTASLLRELHRGTPRAWREQLLLTFVTLATMTDQALEHPEALEGVAAALEVNVDEVASRPGVAAALAKFRPSTQATAYTPNEVASLLANDSVRVVDVRDTGSFARHHVPSAVFLDPLLAVDRPRNEVKPVVLYCRSGDTSKAIAEELAKHRDGVGWLAGGYIAWEVAGHRVERP